MYFPYNYKSVDFLNFFCYGLLTAMKLVGLCMKKKGIYHVLSI